jgi:HAD superfamily hydrolase (TIGR01549 family)
VDLFSGTPTLACLDGYRPGAGSHTIPRGDSRRRIIAREHFAPTFERLETSAAPTTEAEIEWLWEQYDFKVLGALAIQIDVDSMHKVVLPAFWSEAAYPETHGVLQALRERGYKLAIVSNGCYQTRCARRLGIEGYFDAIIGSWHVGYRKPGREIFDIAISQLGLTANEAVMVGDSWDLDIAGGHNAGLHAPASMPGRQRSRALYQLHQGPLGCGRVPGRPYTRLGLRRAPGALPALRSNCYCSTLSIVANIEAPGALRRSGA